MKQIPFEEIRQILNDVMAKAVENGANSVSMPDEYVAVAHFLSFPEQYMKGMPEPDWADSKTLPSEMWKNPLIPMNERLEIADGAVRFREEIIANLRRQLQYLTVTISSGTSKYSDIISDGGLDPRN